MLSSHVGILERRRHRHNHDRRSAALFGQAEAWVDGVLSGSIFDLLEESSEVYEVADELHDRRAKLFKVRIYLLTNNRLSSKVKEFPSVERTGSHSSSTRGISIDSTG